MKLALNISLLIFLFTSQIQPQQFTDGSPEWLVDMFFSKSSFPNKADYYIGEMLNDINELTIGEELKGEGEITFRQINASTNEIVFAVELKHNNKIIDFYFYMVKHDDEWKINSVRRFILPPFIYTVYDSLSNLNSLSLSDSTFYLSLKLFTMNDTGLRNYLNLHLKEMQELVLHFNQEQSNKIQNELTSLGCNAIFKDRKYPTCVFIQILAFEKMEAGFLYSSEPSKLPKISQNDFICIEEVAPGWFIYRII